MVKLRARLVYILFAGLILSLFTPPTLAAPLQSAHYTFEETSLGGLGSVGSQSAHYQNVQSSGSELGLGTSASTSFQLKTGNTTTNDPALTFLITAGGINFPAFSTAAASVTTSTFSVIDYTSYGYVVQMLGNPPSNGSHTLTALSTTGPSQAGVEQFGVNLVANTSPVSVGANPNHGQFGVGSASSGYNTPNSYRFVSGETIASAPKSSGETDYTISYLVNVNGLTPGGQYATHLTLVCTGTY